MNRPQVALATLIETREDFRRQREPYVREELEALGWLRESAEVLESEPIASASQVQAFASKVRASEAQALIVHIPVWTDPVLTVKLSAIIDLPKLLLGNSRPETSSTVGLLGAGGALDQIGVLHRRVFDHRRSDEQRCVVAFGRAAAAANRLKGQTLGLFGGRSLGIATASADPAQWQQVFGVDIEPLDQQEIVGLAGTLPDGEVERHLNWLVEKLGEVQFGGRFTRAGLERQVRSYLATRRLVARRGLDFVGVKCQPELSDGYATQCVAHMLINGQLDADGEKPAIVHACEADADGALTMQILHLLSGGSPTALLDMRWLDTANGVWTLANCGAIPAAFAATAKDGSGLSGVRMVPHVFGRGGGGALPMVVGVQQVTLARLCRRKREYWMAVLPGQVEERNAAQLAYTTAAFPQAFVKTMAGEDFLQMFGSNHIHMVSGDLVPELKSFCALKGIECHLWD